MENDNVNFGTLIYGMLCTDGKDNSLQYGYIEVMPWEIFRTPVKTSYNGSVLLARITYDL